MDISNTLVKTDYLPLFLKSREAMEVSGGTMGFYRVKLGRFLREVDPDRATLAEVEDFLIQFANSGNRHAYYRVIRTFFRWRQNNFALESPIRHLRAPKMGKLIHAQFDPGGGAGVDYSGA